MGVWESKIIEDFIIKFKVIFKYIMKGVCNNKIDFWFGL